MKKSLRKLLIVFLAVAAAIALVAGLSACGEVSEKKYTLSYSRGDDSAIGEIPKAKEYGGGEEITLASADTFTLEGYTFIGWSDGNKTYEAGSTFTMPARNVTLTAQWRQNEAVGPKVSATEVGFEDGWFVLRGTVEDVVELYVYLVNPYHLATLLNFAEATVSEGNFEARLSLASLLLLVGEETSDAFYVRYKIDDILSEEIGLTSDALDLTSTCNYAGHRFFLVVNSASDNVGVCFTANYDSGASVKVTSVGFEGGAFVVNGTADNVYMLVVYLMNFNYPYTLNNCVFASCRNGLFEARLSLQDLVSLVGRETNDPFYLCYLTDDSDSLVSVAPDSLDLSATYRFGGHDFRIGVDGGYVAVYFSSAYTDPDPDPGPGIGSFGLYSVGLEVDSECVYLIYNGFYFGYNQAEMEAILENYVIDIEFNERILLDLTYEVMDSNQTFTLRADISDPEIYSAKGFYYMHGAVVEGGDKLAGLEALGEYANIRTYQCMIATGMEEVVFNGFIYTLGEQWDTIGLTIGLTYDIDADGVMIEKEGDEKIYLVISGSYSTIFYPDADELKATLEGVKYDAQNEYDLDDVTVLDNVIIAVGSYGTFTVKLDVTSLKTGRFWLHFGGKDIRNTSTGDEVEFNGKTYKFVYEIMSWGTAYLFEITDPDTPVKAITSVGLQIEEGDFGVQKLMYVITYSYANYTVQTLEEELASLNILFDLQRNPYMYSNCESYGGDWSYFAFFDISYVINEEESTFAIKIDISSLVAMPYYYTSHFELSEKVQNTTEENSNVLDFKPDIDSFTQTVEFCGYSVEMVYVKFGDEHDFWGCVGIIITEL